MTNSVNKRKIQRHAADYCKRQADLITYDINSTESVKRKLCWLCDWLSFEAELRNRGDLYDEAIKLGNQISEQPKIDKYLAGKVKQLRVRVFESKGD